MDKTKVAAEKKRFKCEICGLFLSRKMALINHKRIAHQNRRQKCPKCGKIFSHLNSGFLDHFQKSHPPSNSSSKGQKTKVNFWEDALVTSIKDPEPAKKTFPYEFKPDLTKARLAYCAKKAKSAYDREKHNYSSSRSATKASSGEEECADAEPADIGNGETSFSSGCSEATFSFAPFDEMPDSAHENEPPDTDGNAKENGLQITIENVFTLQDQALEDLLPIVEEKVGICEASFESQNTSENNAHDGEIKSCSYCGISWRDEFKLAFHKKVIHDKRHNFLGCSVCGMQFRTRHSAKIHEVAVHKVIHSFACKNCGRNFENINNLCLHFREDHHQNSS